MKTRYILALDIGGTKLAVALFDTSFNLIGRSRTPTHADRGPDAVLERLIRISESLMKRHKVRANALESVGVGCGGPLDSETGVIYSPPNLPGWDAFPLKEKLENHFSVPAHIDNDANAAALGEQKFGAGRGYRNIFYITASTGIGSGLVLDGRIYRGADYSAGEFGHIVLARRGPKCNCGGRGCLEALSSGTAIARRANREAARAPDSLLAHMRDRNDSLTAKDVVNAMRQGDPFAEKIFLDAAFYLGLGITSAIHLLNPDIVIIGGGLSLTGRLLFDPVRQTVRDRAQQHLAGHVPIVPAELGKKVGLYGALAVTLNR
jgi:glucokinase